MEIPKKVRNELDKLYEAYDNPDYIVDYKGKYLPKKGNLFTIRHYHHVDRDRSNNELWNIVPIGYNDHIIEIHSRNNKEVKQRIYEFMCNQFPEHEEHYRKYLLEVQMIECSYCQNKINTEIDTYFKCLDNFIQTKYFDTEDENIFCSQECFCNYVQLEEMEKGE